MDDKEFKNVYQSVNNQKCIFEKATLTRRYSCSKVILRYIGEREAAGCTDPKACELCQQLICAIREKCNFALHTTGTGSRPLAHAKEIKVQCGGLSGLERLVNANQKDGQSLLQMPDEKETSSLPNVQDISQTIKMTLQQYLSVEQLPWPQIVQAVTQFSGRKKKRSRV